ncbi:baseplate J/gp47 family protein [Paenibacillus assamensis]|uniref:baseplate J/gp47 family protein n=1 Tax=Paenibacillus assamensis TaxID=311244 RepID=UPI0004264560|nr:baseplate J/gp47 family protein [Paenibacillus assamensis]
MTYYADMTYERILERSLSRVPDGIDKREGSIIYDALAPAVAELAQMYIELEQQLDLKFADTATGVYLDRAIAWSGLIRKGATKAQLKSVFYDAANKMMDVPIGGRYAIDDVTYRVAERLLLGNFRMEAEIAGERGNQHFGMLLPIDYVANLARAELTELLVPGVEEESDEELRARYFASARRPATSGNKHHYMEWALQIPGVGHAKVFPLWNGPKTVKVVIVDSDKLPATSSLVQQVQDHIDPVKGRGEGQAPIGAEVTVASGRAKTINIKAVIKLAAGHSLQSAIQAFSARFEKWRKEAVFESSYISQAVIGALLLGTEGIVDYSSLLLNGGTGNIALADDEVPIAGAIDLGVQ